MIVIGSRGSDLALWQAHHIMARLQAGGHLCRLEIIRTQGDRILDRSFAQMPGKGFFTKELETALLDTSIDLAVHSLKDLPTASPPGLILGAIPERADARDCLLLRAAAHAADDRQLPIVAGARVGTSAIRRQVQLSHLRPDLVLMDLRGNVPTRVGRLRAGDYDAILLAQAGLDRLQLDLSDLVAVPLAPAAFVPAPGQGALGLQIRATDARLVAALAPLNAAAAILDCVTAERQVLAQLEGGCHTPLGTHAWRDGAGLHLRGFLGDAAEPGRSQHCLVHADKVPQLVGRALAALVGPPWPTL